MRPIDNIKWGGGGECSGSVTAKKLYSTKKFALWVKIKAGIANPSNAYVGKVGVTKMAGTNLTTAGMPLDSGQETDWLPVPNHDLSKVYIICDSANDHVSYQYLI